MPPARPRLVAALGLVGLLLLAGCAQIAVHSTVQSADVIEEYRMEITTSRTVYGILEDRAEQEGYDSVRDALLRDLDLEEVGAEDVSYDESFDGDEVTMTLTMTGVDPDEFDSVSLTETDDTIVYEDRSFVDETGAIIGATDTNVSVEVPTGFAVDYYLTMPGPIVESNADAVDGNTAEWHATGSEAFTNTSIRAESEQPTIAPVPGFGVLVALLAIGLLSLVGILKAR